MARTADRLKKLQDLLQRVKMEDPSFDSPIPATITIQSGKVTAFIRERTRIWRETWVIPIVQELLDQEKARLGKRRVRDAKRGRR